MKAGIAMAVLGLGVLLLILGGFWTSLFSGSSSWTTEKVERNSQVKARMNEVAHLLLRQPANKATLQAEMDALTKENEELNAQFKSASESPQSTSKYMKWSGISLAVLGIIGWYAASQSR
jgi:hypothetical protein